MVYRIRAADQGYRAAGAGGRKVNEMEPRLMELVDEFRGAVAFLDKVAFPGAWEEHDNVRCAYMYGVDGSLQKTLAEVETVILQPAGRGA